MVVSFGHDIGVVAFGELCQFTLDHVSIALVNQPGISMLVVDDAPIIGVFKITPKPDETVKALPVASGLLGRFLKSEFTKLSCH